MPSLIKLTDNWHKTALARAVPHAFFQDGAWWLHAEGGVDPESARVALKLLPALYGTEPELVAAARLSAVDTTPIDLATERWNRLYPDGRPTSEDPWQRVLSQCRATGIEPHEFQRIDADYFLAGLDAGKGGYAGHEMGLGKTLLACMVIDSWNANYVFIACPNSAKMKPWASELARFCPWLKVVVVGNCKKDRDCALAQAREFVQAGTPFALICHYQAIPLIEGKNKRGWKALGTWDLLISDEAHLYKNRTAKFVGACRRLEAIGRLDLSGSVMSGRAEDLFVPFQMHQPRRYRSQHRDWNDRFLESMTDDYGVKHIIGPMVHRLPEFRAELGEILTVRLAKDYLSVPEARVVERELTMYPEQGRAYRELADELLAKMPDDSTVATIDGAPLRTALRRVTAGVPLPCGVCAGSEDLYGDECDSCGGSCSVGLLSAKHDAAMEDILNAGDSQIVMFGWHKKTVRELQRRCLAARVPCGVIDGDVPNAQRERTLDLFERGGYRVLAATIATLSTAANLQFASVVGMLEESDDPVDNEQAIGRVVRQGQLAHATVYNYRIEGSVDTLSVQANYSSKAELRKLVLGA